MTDHLSARLTLLDAQIIDCDRLPIGRVDDLELRFPTDGDPPEVARVLWGFAEERSQGPWPLRMLTRRAARQARFVPAELVRSWEPGRVVIGAEAAQLEPLRPTGPL